jgi:hypothetical protein
MYVPVATHGHEDEPGTEMNCFDLLMQDQAASLLARSTIESPFISEAVHWSHDFDIHGSM